MVEHRNINPKTVIVCPKCVRKQLTITGHNRNAWHQDKKSGAMIRQVYVSCPCTRHLLRNKETLEDVGGIGCRSCWSVNSRRCSHLFTKPSQLWRLFFCLVKSVKPALQCGLQGIFWDSAGLRLALLLTCRVFAILSLNFNRDCGNMEPHQETILTYGIPEWHPNSEAHRGQILRLHLNIRIYLYLIKGKTEPELHTENFIIFLKKIMIY